MELYPFYLFYASFGRKRLIKTHFPENFIALTACHQENGFWWYDLFVLIAFQCLDQFTVRADDLNLDGHLTNSVR
jgi:hypothetical protein